MSACLLWDCGRVMSVIIEKSWIVCLIGYFLVKLMFVFLPWVVSCSIFIFHKVI